ncbi:MAG: DUF1345 domain-containing protein [Mesorhizobium sp.]|nr:DUF1345 domain-containing protein [Mesorhizobium sp.]MBL8578597.1 DUF1345 domain-containing protein [Mesorhizobium sp.]
MKSLRRYAPFYAALVCGLGGLGLALWLIPELAVQVAANAFFIVYLTLEFLKFRRLTPDFLRKHAASTDEPAWVIVLVTFGAVVAAVGSLFLLLNRGGQPNALDLFLSLTSVALGWASIHTMIAVHYAHIYWRPDGHELDASGARQLHKGLDFPGDDEPGIYDFLYYSFVVGMTAQTADVNITKTRMRKLTMLHGVVSFFFNTVLVAAAVNVVVSLAAG